MGWHVQNSVDHGIPNIPETSCHHKKSNDCTLPLLSHCPLTSSVTSHNLALFWFSSFSFTWRESCLTTTTTISTIQTCSLTQHYRTKQAEPILITLIIALYVWWIGNGVERITLCHFPYLFFSFFIFLYHHLCLMVMMAGRPQVNLKHSTQKGTCLEYFFQ